MEERSVTILPPRLNRKREEAKAEEKARLRVAAYCRVSTDSDEQATSYETQIEHYTLFIQNNPEWILAGIFADDGISGTNTKKRDEFNRMIEECKAGNIDMIITKSISRFARNTIDCLKYIRQLKALNIAVFFEKENINTMDSKGEVLLTIMASLAQQESESLSQNVKLGIQFRYQQGIVQVNHNRFLGYTKDADKHLVIVPEEAESVKRIYREYLEGANYKEISSGLEADGILTAAGNPRWHSSTLKKILTNEKYMGDALLQKTYTVDCLTKKRVANDGTVPQYYVNNDHDAIIPRELFTRVQEEMKRRVNIRQGMDGKKRVYSSKYALSSIVFCGHCNDVFRRTHWNNHGKKQIVWRCITRLDAPGVECSARTLSEVQLQNLVLEAINKVLGGKQRAIKVLETNISQVLGNAHTEELERIRKQIEKQQTLLVKMTAASEDYSKVVDNIYALQNEQKQAMADSVNYKAQAERTEEMIEYLKSQPKRVTAYDEQLVRKLIEKITVFDDHLNFLFKSGIQIEIKG